VVGSLRDKFTKTKRIQQYRQYEVFTTCRECCLRTRARVCEHSTRHILQAPRTRTVYGGRAFRSAVAAIWNNLSTSVIEASSLPVFRRRYTHLFTVAFEASG